MCEGVKDLWFNIIYKFLFLNNFGVCYISEGDEKTSFTFKLYSRHYIINWTTSTKDHVKELRINFGRIRTAKGRDLLLIGGDI